MLRKATCFLHFCVIQVVKEYPVCMENARMLAAMVSRAPVRAVIPENTATHMSVRSYLSPLSG